MLSTTNTVADVKAKLVNDYDFYGYTSDAAFTSAIESAAYDVQLLLFYPRIGEDAYTTLAAKNKVGLTEYEIYLYFAEVYSICYELLRWVESIRSQLQNSSEESLTVEGYSYKTKSSSGGGVQVNVSLKSYYDKMVRYWKLAGYNIFSLQRSCTIFGEPNSEDIERSIIE